MTDCAVSLGGVHTVFGSASPNQTLAFSTLCTPPEDPETSMLKDASDFKQTTVSLNHVQQTSRPNETNEENGELYLLVQ